jgi:hypothetical protein
VKWLLCAAGVCFLPFAFLDYLCVVFTVASPALTFAFWIVGPPDSHDFAASSTFRFDVRLVPLAVIARIGFAKVFPSASRLLASEFWIIDAPLP